MKTRLLTAIVIASIPLAGIAADTDKTSSTGQASFQALDANKDGRISMPEASADAKLVESFSTADKNGDGYLDAAEYASTSTPQQKQ